MPTLSEGISTDMYAQRSCEDKDFIKEEIMEKRTIPEFITSLEPNEIENIVLPPNW